MENNIPVCILDTKVYTFKYNPKAYTIGTVEYICQKFTVDDIFSSFCYLNEISSKWSHIKLMIEKIIL